MMDFVEGWAITQTLGEGAYGEVKLVVNKVTGEGVAMKIIHKNPEIYQEVLKEINIHKSLKHPNIISFYGARTHGRDEFIFLEYAPHGELFDRIEPDVGTPSSESRKYFGQLLDAVEYMHSRGISHRDIKPENILLDENYNLKLTDFGLATQFKKGNQERALDKKCGTLPYVAPEVWLRPYAAEPADIWSCGIVLVALLTGELPWDKADTTCCDYVAWVKGDYANLTPWSKLDTQPLSLLKRILVPKPSGRYTISQIRAHRWLQSSGCQNIKFDALVSLSQGTLTTKFNEELCCNISLFLSQPTSLENMLVSTQSYTQSGSALTTLQQMVKRITRFVSKLGLSSTMEHLKQVIDKLKLNYNLCDSVMTVTTVDKRGNTLIFKATAIKISEGTLLDFRLSKGCGLEFKKHYVAIRKYLQDIIVVTPLFST